MAPPSLQGNLVDSYNPAEHRTVCFLAFDGHCSCTGREAGAPLAGIQGLVAWKVVLSLMRWL